MPVSTYLSVILDPEFGPQIEEKLGLGAMWIIDTPTNRIAVDEHWAQHPGQSYLEAVTTFAPRATGSSEDVLLEWFDTIDLHHGDHSADTPYRVLEVIGVDLSLKIEATLKEYGLVEFENTLTGFKASRLHEHSPQT
jgi:hypothetical protein